MQKVMVIGSGPIVIGQAAEFDYAGTQACQALREEGFEVVLLNSNPATIMTDDGSADRVYIEPLTVEHAAAVMERERPQGLLATLGGQAGLNLAVDLVRAGVLERYGVRLLGTPIEAIRKAEDRELFKQTMLEIGEPVAESRIVHTLEEGLAFADEIGLPLIVRPAYTLGGSGGGLAGTRRELEEVVVRGLRRSPIGQVLIERSLYGWKEIEYEVMRDATGACISVCNMENLDPVGVHTGDSIVVAPSQTLSDRDYQRLRAASFRIIRALGIEGGCNVQLALDPRSDAYYVIEVNPRVSRSSALASKATGYPIAKMAARIAVGRALHEIRNPVTGTTTAFFEPALDYVVLKVPRWPFDKFRTADRRLGTQMKATGEVMAIDRSFEGALQKAVRSLDTGCDGLVLDGAETLADDELSTLLAAGDDRRLFLLAEAFRRGWRVDALAAATAIDPWFLAGIERIVAIERDPSDLPAAKRAGFSDQRLAALVGESVEAVRRKRPPAVYKMVDTCAAEFEATTPYFYSCYEAQDEARGGEGRPKVVVLGSGPIRIGQGIEFDYGSVHAVWALRAAGYEAVIVNNNPETVSTDFDTADRLYFEPLTVEDVLNVVEKEHPVGVVCQFGGQTAINLARPLEQAGVRVLGTSVHGIDLSEDRGRFDALLEELGVPRPAGGAAGSLAEARAVARRAGYPVLVRPSYVLGGRGMEVCHDEAELGAYVEEALAAAAPGHPLLVDHYVEGTEVEVDAVGDGENVLVAGILEHIERAGVHSGDSTAVYPPQTLSPAAVQAILRYTLLLARGVGVVGLMNVQYVVQGDEVRVIEVNPRASRTVPFLTKVTGVPLVSVALRAILGESLPAQGHPGPVWLPEDPGYVAVKLPVFSWAKMAGVDTALGPEMKSTGEVMGVGPTLGAALAKGFLACGVGLPRAGSTVVAAIADRDKAEAVEVLRLYRDLGCRIVATPGTLAALAAAGVTAEPCDDPPGLLRAGEADLVVNTLTRGQRSERLGFRLRRAAADLGVPCVTSLDTARALAAALAAGHPDDVLALQDYASLRVRP